MWGPLGAWARLARRAGAARLGVALAAAFAVLVAGGCGGSAAATDAAGGPPSATPSAASPSSSAASSGATTRIVFVDVGQGDAAVIRSGSWSGLIDGGPQGAAPRVSAALAKLGVRRLDAVVVSHFHADHTGGLTALVARYRPRLLLAAGRPAGELAATVRRSGTTVKQVRRGQTMRWGAATATVLSPGKLSGDANADSVVVLVEVAGRRLLFTGDCSGPNEAAVGAILARGPPVGVLKVSHHGSRHSTTAAFVRGARPRVAVISVGSNSYGHPSNDAVRRLRRSGARVYSTRRNGSVGLTITSRGALRWTFSRSSSPLTRGVTGGSGD